MNRPTPPIKQEHHPSAIRIVASTLGILVGLAGINHGIFEILQGDTRPTSLLVAAIGPGQRFWQYGEETALTIVPSFLISGILAVLLGIAVIDWAGWFIERKGGALILLMLASALTALGYDAKQLDNRGNMAYA